MEEAARLGSIVSLPRLLFAVVAIYSYAAILMPLFMTLILLALIHAIKALSFSRHSANSCLQRNLSIVSVWKSQQ